MTSVQQQFVKLWSNYALRVALWADSSYAAGKLEEKDMLKLARDMNFPLVHFTGSYDAGLTVAGCDNHATHATPTPADVVMIEMGYNDDRELAPNKVASKMRKQTWYKVLAESTSLVKFVVFIHQPTYRDGCPPISKNQARKWVKGTLVEGSKFTDKAIELCQELGIPALCLRGTSAEELFQGMLRTDEQGTVWQTEDACRSYTSEGKDFTENGQLALWEDCHHPTVEGAVVHFRCLVKAFKARCIDGSFVGATIADPVGTISAEPHWGTRGSATQAARADSAWSSLFSSMPGNGDARFRPF